MNKCLTILILFLSHSIIFSQKNKSEKFSVENSIFSIQTGYFGTWINHELKINKTIALRTELGTEYKLKFAIKQSFDSLKNQVSLFLEPKYYFNLTKRKNKNKNVKNNAGNYVSLRTNVNISNNLEKGEIYFYNLTPTFGVRRNITTHFNLELSFGYGVNYSNSLLTIEAMPSLRLGYVF